MKGGAAGGSEFNGGNGGVPGQYDIQVGRVSCIVPANGQDRMSASVIRAATVLTIPKQRISNNNQ